MKRLWITDDIYRYLHARRQGHETLIDTMRRALNLPKRKYKRTNKKSEAVQKGIAKAKRRGVIVGRPRYPEYMRNDARKRKRSGWTLAQIGRYWSVSRSTVKRILRER